MFPMNIKLILLPLAVTAILAGCRDETPAPPDQDVFLRNQLIGLWTREWEFGPVIYERQLNLDGSLVVREYRAAQAAAMPATSQPDVPTRMHRHYNVDLPMYQEFKGTWEVKDGQIQYLIHLPGGDIMRLKYQVARVSAFELLESTEGIEGKVESLYIRTRTAH